jgi:transposase InsO family protein
MKWVESGTKPPSTTISGHSQFVKAICSQWDALEIDDGMLFRRKKQKNGSSILQAIVPFSERRTLLGQYHDERTSAHLGVKKTLAKIKRKYYWPGLQKDVKSYIAGCEKCQRRKPPNKTKKAPMQVVTSGSPMERIATDILGELPKSNNGNRYILVVSDYFTKWTESFPMANMEAATVARIIVEEVVARFGVPGSIHSDQGVQFESHLFREMCRLLNIKKTHTTPYHPQSDGMVERFNKTLTTMLSAYVNDHHDNWDEHLPYVMMAYRAAIHETTGTTPNKMMLGREVATPLDIVYEMPTDMKRIPQNTWVWELQEKLEKAHSAVREMSKDSIQRQKWYHDRKLNWQSFESGDQVYVYFPKRRIGTSPKFSSYWHGPFTIIEKCSSVTYKVNCGPRGTHQVIHTDRIRPLTQQRLICEPVVCPPANEGSDSEVMGDIESLTDKRHNKRPAYLADYVLD